MPKKKTKKEKSKVVPKENLEVVPKEKSKDDVPEEDFWDTEEEPEDRIHDDEDTEVLDPDKLEYTKLKDLKTGMEDVNVVATIDFVGELMGRGFGEEPRAIGFIKDKTGEIKITFWGEAARTAKKGMKIRVMKGFVSEYRGQVQLNSNRAYGVEFIK